MAIPPPCIPAVRDLVRELVGGDIDTLARAGRAGRLTAAELRWALAHYGVAIRANGGGEFVADLPDEAFHGGGAMATLIDEAPTTWAIDLDLWTTRGRSDRTLSLTAREEAGRVLVAISDLHVL